IDISDTTHPFITGEFLLDQNQLSFCGSAADTPVAEQFRSFSAHNPTVLQDLAFIDWHSNGVQAIPLIQPMPAFSGRRQFQWLPQRIQPSVQVLPRQWTSS